MLYLLWLLPGAACVCRFLGALGHGCQMLLGFGLASPGGSAFLQRHAAQLPDVALFLDSGPALQGLSNLRGYSPSGSSGSSSSSDSLLSTLLPWLKPKPSQSEEVAKTVAELLSRRNSEDFLFIYLVLINQYLQVIMTTR